MDHHRLSGSGNASGPTHTNDVRAPRTIEPFLDAQVQQHEGLASLMRRIEDMADRVAGTTPASDANQKGPAAGGAGLIGVLWDAHFTRDQIGGRIASALQRIEEVL